MGEKSEIASKSSIATLQLRALDLIASRPQGVFQSDLRRLLEIDSSKCSKLVSRLQRSGHVRREKVPASSTYLIKPISASASTPALFAPATEGKELAACKADHTLTESHSDCHIMSSDADVADSLIEDYTDQQNTGQQSQSNFDDPFKKTISRQINSYFNCCSEGDDNTDISGHIDGYFDSQRLVNRNSHIDSYLTEIYLLYLTRAASF